MRQTLRLATLGAFINTHTNIRLLCTQLINNDHLHNKQLQ